MLVAAITFSLWVTTQHIETGKFSHPHQVGTFNSLRECGAELKRVTKQYPVRGIAWSI
jgi:hypothetical protein